MEDNLKIERWNISATTGRILPKFETKAYGTKPNVIETENEK
jgi:hypothetical protein